MPITMFTWNMPAADLVIGLAGFLNAQDLKPKIPTLKPPMNPATNSVYKFQANPDRQPKADITAITRCAQLLASRPGRELRRSCE